MEILNRLLLHDLTFLKDSTIQERAERTIRPITATEPHNHQPAQRDAPLSH